MRELIERKVKPTFGGHEKFVFRYGWLKKGVDATRKNPAIFAEDEALIELGVGKNMVRSIRHWCLATGLLEETPSKSLARPLRLSTLAKKLVGPKGWDPYFEDNGSLWLIHWQLTANLKRGFVWHLTFSEYLEPEFTRAGLRAFMDKQFEQSGINTTAGTIDREIEYCLKTYIPSERTKQSGISEETLECPLAELEILRFIAEDDVYRFNIGPKPSLPVGIFGYALYHFLAQVAQNRRTVTVDECLYQPASPGQAFKLDENSLIEYLEKLEVATQHDIRLQETAGLRQIYISQSNKDFVTRALASLEQHYEQR
jgi:hypothetical protein